MMQADRLVVSKPYQRMKIIPLQEKRYILDLTYIANECVFATVVNTENRELFCRPSHAYCISTYGAFVCFTNEMSQRGVIYSAGHSLKHHPGSSDCESPNTLFVIKDGKYTPNGIAVCKSGAILIALWNREVQDKSRGKVWKTTMSGERCFEMETDKNRRLFICPTYITENTNEDICVSDVGAVVVTDIGGMHKFRYEGLSGDSYFDPYGICCDSRCNIIVADMKNNNIHMIDQNGEFLHYIQYDGIKMPRALCIDEKDNLYVGEWNCDAIKVISSQ